MHIFIVRINIDENIRVNSEVVASKFAIKAEPLSIAFKSETEWAITNSRQVLTLQNWLSALSRET